MIFYMYVFFCVIVDFIMAIICLIISINKMNYRMYMYMLKRMILLFQTNSFYVYVYVYVKAVCCVDETAIKQKKESYQFY